MLGIVVLVWQWVDVYFAIGEIPTPTDAQVVRYRVTAAITLAAMAVALVTGLRNDQRWIARGAGVGLVLSLVTAVLLAVPTLDLRQDPEPPSPAPAPGRNPCFSGTACDAAG